MRLLCMRVGDEMRDDTCLVSSALLGWVEFRRFAKMNFWVFWRFSVVRFEGFHLGECKCFDCSIIKNFNIHNAYWP